MSRNPSTQDGTTRAQPIRPEDVGSIFTLLPFVIIPLGFALILAFGYLQDKGILDPGELGGSASLLVSSLLWSGCFLLGAHLLLRKYKLRWNRLDWLPASHRPWIAWSAVLIPLCAGSYLLETRFWSEVVSRWSWTRSLLSFSSIPDTIPPTVVAWALIALAALIAAVGHSVLLQWVMTHVRVRVGCVDVAFGYLLFFGVGAPVGLPFTTALLVTWGYRRTRTLLTPIVVSAISVLVLVGLKSSE